MNIRALKAGISGQFVCCSVLLILGAAGSHTIKSALDSIPKPELSRAMEEFPMRLGEWVGKEEKLAPTVIKVANADTHVSRIYSSGPTARYLYVSYYGQPYKDLPHPPERCLGGQGWEVARKETVELTSDGDTFEVAHVLFVKGAEKFAAAYWFVDTGKPVITLDSLWTKIARVFKTRKGERQWVFQVQIQMSRVTDNEAETWRRSDDLAREVWAELKKHFPKSSAAEGKD